MTSLLSLTAVCANSSMQWSAPRRRGPCRCQCLAGSSALVREFRQGRQPMLWAHRQPVRLGARPLEVGFGYGWRLLPSFPQTGTSVSGTISATAPSPRAHPRSLPVRSSPFHPRKSNRQMRLALPQEESRTPMAPQSCSRPLSTTDRSPLTKLPYLLCVVQTISGLITSLTLIPVRDVPTAFVPATFWLSVRPQATRGSDG